MFKTYVVLFFALMAFPVFAAPCIPDDVATRLLACPAVEIGDEQIDAFATAACYVKNPEELASIRHLQGKRYYDAEQMVEAAALFRYVVQEHTSADVAVHAANLYLDSLNVLQCFDELAEAVDRIADDEQLMRDEELRETVAALRVNIERRRGNDLFSEKRYLEAAELFLEIAGDFPDWYDDTSRCHLLFNAAMAFERARLPGRAIAQYRQLIDRFPGCELTKDATFAIGAHFHALQMHEQAADHLLEFARKYPGEPEAPEVLSNAITFLIGTGQIERSWESAKLFEKLYARRLPEMTATVNFSVGYLHINNQDWKHVREHFARYLKRYSRVGNFEEQIQAHVFIGDSYRLQRKPKPVKASKHYGIAIEILSKDVAKKRSLYVNDRVMVEAAAKATYYLAMERYDEFMAIELPAFEVKKKVPSKIRKWWTEQNPGTIWRVFDVLPTVEDVRLLQRDVTSDYGSEDPFAAVMGVEIGE